MQSRRFCEALGISSEDKKLELHLLGQGEYNVNYWFYHPKTKEKLVLRVNTGSQIHLDNQILYEYETLKLLQNSKRTPHPIFADDEKTDIEYGIMVMEFLEGRPLNYHTDMKLAAECLADIHSVPIEKDSILLSPKNCLRAILDECHEMIEVYNSSPLGEERKKTKIRKMLERGESKLATAEVYEGQVCCINTELNSGNFLINGEGEDNYLVDWEKALLGDMAQDLGHFLAPTTTFWKTDVILSEQEMDDFVEEYKKQVGNRIEVGNLEERLKLFLPINCLRGITWCAMAWIQYQSGDKLIKNEETWGKLNRYLSDDFLEEISRRYEL